MFATICACTHEWSLMRMRPTAFTFAACHHAFSCASSLTRSSRRRSLRVPRTGTLIRICATACAGVSRVSRSASAETGCSIRSSVSRSRSITASVCRAWLIMARMEPHPVRIRIEDDLERSRLTVFFRLLLALPHIGWLLLWTVVALLAAVVNWLATLIRGLPPRSLPGFLAAYIRYSAHLGPYVFLAANPFPGFTGRPGSYPIDLELGEPERQNRWITGFRIFLAIPALIVAGALAGSGGIGVGRVATAGLVASGGAVMTLAFLSWFACLVRAREPRGIRDAIAYALRYAGQADAYLFCLTDRYPTADPRTEATAPGDLPHPVRLALTDDGIRSRL